jgi:biotin carboxylase
VSFLPSPGKIQKWIAPGGKDVRLDTHAYCNYIIPTYYDSMIGKVIVWGENRDRAIAKMRRALDEFEVGGCAHRHRVPPQNDAQPRLHLQQFRYQVSGELQRVRA